ncbi:hypothetical protein HOLleu_06110 [Holothuria leucospilota]|uniref:Amine oxidase domain-containing protein n=1 Tax=Holothuria leucospilota TaxID=206669 RepID=A0A9Q1CLM4_HOLLE|nr:hypothetical protein HOLleu_06110 [Holothuria leucospilota]
MIHEIAYRCKDAGIHRDIVIIGSGPTGLGAALRLHELRKGFGNTTITILEQEREPGGLATSERDERGFLWDMGGHVVFSHYDFYDTTIDRAVPEWNQRVRAAFAFMMGSDGTRRFIPYPVQNHIEVMDDVDRTKCLEGLETVAQQPRHDKPQNFDDWLLQNFGPGLCDVFMRKYNKKIWTVDTKEMNSVWVGEYVAVPDINRIKENIEKYRLDKKIQRSDWGLNSLFRYPKYNGTGGMWKGVAKLIPTQWFQFNSKVTGINIKLKEISYNNRKESCTQSMTYNTLISTIPLDVLVNLAFSDKVKQLDHMKKLVSQLQYSHTHVVGIGLVGQPPTFLKDKSWMYFPDSDSPFYRVTVFSNYSDDHVPKAGVFWSLLCESAEPKAKHNSSKWAKENIIKDTIEALVLYGFISANKVVSRYHRRLDHGYPIPSLTREKILDIVQPWLESNGIYSRGRFGGWKYEVSSQDHSFMQGVEVIDKVLRNEPEETYPRPNIVNSQRNIGRFIDPNPEYEFVISHYKEDLSWMKPLAHYSHVYHKANNSGPPFYINRWEKLPNVGREGHTYLHHIIQNYNNLANITVFLQGEGPNRPFCYKEAMTFVAKAKSNLFCVHFGIIEGWDKINHIGKWLQEYRTGAMRKATISLRDFYQTLFGCKPPSDIPRCLSGCFSATRENIRKHPKEFYLDAISYVNDHMNPEEGHYLERLWYAIINPEKFCR